MAIIAYWIVTVILALLWLIVLFLGPFVAADEADSGKEAFKAYAVAVSGVTIIVLAWPVLLGLAFPVLFVYGSFHGIKMLIQKPWRN